jgi:Zn-dependent metalloprotease
MLYKKILLIILCFTTANAFCQDKYEFENKIVKNGFITFASIKNYKKIIASENDRFNLLNQLVNFDKEITYQKIKSEAIDKNVSQDKYQLFKNGIKIRGSEYIINSVGGELSFVHGFFANFIDGANFIKSNILPFKLSALNYFNDSKLDKNLQDVKDNNLIYYFNPDKGKFQIAYQFRIESSKSTHAENVFVSAINAEFLGAENLICGINFPGVAQTQYNGLRNIVADAPTVAGPFRLQELRNNVLIRTRNNNFQNTEVAGALDLIDNDNNWTFAEHGNLRSAFDAHWGAETVYDYWLNLHSRNSINGGGMPIESFINVNVGGNQFNAFWFSNRMYYGNGISGSNAVTSLDICAHEFGHGIDQFTGDLLYEKESGALDEGFADIWGAAVEAWATPTKQRWTIGEDVLGGPIRSLVNPKLFGQPDTYQGINWVNTECGKPSRFNDYCGVHTNSGVINRWFFLVSEGGAGTNDIGNSFNVNSLGINVAAQIAYRTKLLMNSSVIDYQTCRQISIQATIQLFGNNSCQEIAVTNAWYAVGVGNPSLTSSILGNDIVCNSSVYQVNNLPPGSSVVWSMPPGYSVLQLAPNTPNLNQVTITNQHWYGVSNRPLTATVTTPNCTYSLIKLIGNDNDPSGVTLSYIQPACLAGNVFHPDQSGTITGATFVHQGCFVYVRVGSDYKTVTVSGGTPQAYGFTDYVYNSGTSSASTVRSLYFQLPLGSGGIPFTFTLSKGTGSCSGGKQILFFSYSNNGFAATPNPASNNLVVSKVVNKEGEKLSLEDKLPYSINIYDFNTKNLLLYQKNIDCKSSYNLNVASLKFGYYLLEVTQGKYVQTIKFLKE